MLDDRTSLWLLMAGKEGDTRTADWVAQGYCAVSWREVGEIPAGTSVGEIGAAIGTAMPDLAAGTRDNWSRQLDRFLNLVEPGHWVVTPDPQAGKVHIGRVTGRPTYTFPGDEFPRRRATDWLIELDRDALPRYATQTAATIQPLIKYRPEVVDVITTFLRRRRSAVAALLTRPYRRADETTEPKAAVPSAPDPDLTARGTQWHARLQNQLADEAAARGTTPYAPPHGGPLFDIAWTTPDGAIVIVEVKSLPPGAETGQLRAGIAQLLDYADAFHEAGHAPRCVLWVERAPVEAERWTRICRRAGITLAWPGEADRVFV